MQIYNSKPKGPMIVLIILDIITWWHVTAIDDVQNWHFYETSVIADEWWNLQSINYWKQ